jgi:hypothetical protein
MWMLGDRWFESRQGLWIFIFTTDSRLALGPTQPLIQLVQGAFSLGVKRPGVNLTTHLYLMPRSRMRGDIPPLPQYALMAWCSVKAQGQLYLYLQLCETYIYYLDAGVQGTSLSTALTISWSNNGFKVECFWVVTPCSVTVGYRLFRCPSCLHLHEDGGSKVIWRVGILPQLYTASEFRKHRLESSLPLKHQISQMAGLFVAICSFERPC